MDNVGWFIIGLILAIGAFILLLIFSVDPESFIKPIQNALVAVIHAWKGEK